MATYAGVNLYASWRSAPCFANHWDDHDVFILQVRGRKVWRLWGEVRRQPLSRDVETNEVAPAHPVWTGTLDEGDVLYIPRGWWHSAHVAEENDGRGTIHLTLSPHYLRSAQLLGWLEAKIAGHEGLRRNVPLLADEGSLRDFLLEYRKVIDAALVEAGEGALARDLQRSWQARSPGQFLREIEPWRGEAWEDLELSIRGWEQARVVTGPGEDVFVLRANGQEFELDARCRSLIELLLVPGSLPHRGVPRDGARVLRGGVRKRLRRGAHQGRHRGGDDDRRRIAAGRAGRWPRPPARRRAGAAATATAGRGPRSRDGARRRSMRCRSTATRTPRGAAGDGYRGSRAALARWSAATQHAVS